MNSNALLDIWPNIVGGRTREEREDGICPPKVFIARGTLLSQHLDPNPSIKYIAPVFLLSLQLRSLEQSVSLLCHFAGVAGRGILAGYKTRRWSRKKEQEESEHISPPAHFPLLPMARAVCLCIARVYCPGYIWLREEDKTSQGRGLYKHYRSTDA